MENNVFSQDDFSDKQPQGSDPTLLTSDSALLAGEPTIEVVDTPTLPVVRVNAAPRPASPALFASPRGGKRLHLWALFIALPIVLLLLLGSGGYVLARSNLPASSATLSITPTHRQFSQTYFVTATPGSTDATLNSIGARRISSSTTLNSIEAHRISYTTPAQSVTVQATGINHHDATYATGTVTIFVFSGGLSAGTYTVTDKNGVAIAFYLSSAPAFRTNTDAPAQAVQAGSAGNIPANDVGGGYQTIPGIDFSLFQTSPFTGGSDASDTTIVAQADIDSATSQVTNQLQSGLAADQMQLKSELGLGEQLLGGDQAITCQPSLNTNQNVNDQASQVTVTGTMTCSALAYSENKRGSELSASQTQLKSELGASEQLLGGDQAITCQPSLDTNQQANDQASQVTVAGTMTCSALAYSSDKLQTYVTNKLTADAARLLGRGYALIGQAQAKVHNQLDQGQTISFNVDVSGRFFYRLSPDVQAHLLSLIVGKTQAEAQMVLVRQPGIAAVSFTVSGGLGTAVPGDAKAIRMRIVGE